MPTKIITQKHSLHMARQLLESVNEPSNTAYYVFAGNHIPRDSNTVPFILEGQDEVNNDPYRNMEFGKRVSANDISLVIKNIPYVANTTYSMWDDQDETLFESDYYVITKESSYYHVYKCLDNNRDEPSTIQPTFAHITGANTMVYQTSDGYRWKYMYSVSDATKRKFSTSDYFPCSSNTSVSSGAIDGAIDVIKVDGTGSGYHNYVTGTLASTQIRVSGDPKLYAISNTNINHTNGFYTSCLLYLSSGTGSGQYAIITDYFSNANGNYVAIDREFTTTPTNGTEFEIYPNVTITGNGRAVVNAVARALVNAYASNSIYRVEMLSRGSGYDYAKASVSANAVVQVTSPAIVRPIYGPFGGHGFDPASELNCRSVMFSTTFANSEANTIPTKNIFQQIGVIKDPKFWNVDISTASGNGIFIQNEMVYRIDPVRIATNASMNTTSTQLAVTGGDFVNQVDAGTMVYLASSNGVNHMVSTVNSVTNSSTIVLGSNGFFACTEVLVYLANPGTSAVFTNQPNSSVISVSNVVGTYQTGDIVVGNSSGSYGVVNSISRSGITKTFDTFVQMYQYVVNISSGTFANNETIYQGNSAANSTANGRFHSTEVVGGSTYLYTTNQIGSFDKSKQIIGANSLAVASISKAYTPEVVVGSGQIMYLENLPTIQRQNNQTETMRIVFSF